MKRKQKVVYRARQTTGERLFDLIYFTSYHFHTFLCVFALIIWKKSLFKQYPAFFRYKILISNSKKCLGYSFKVLNVKYFHVKYVSCLLGGAGFRWITDPGEKYFIGCKGGEQSANQQAGGGYQNPDSENCGKRDRVGKVRYFHFFPLFVSFLFPSSSFSRLMNTFVSNWICVCVQDEGKSKEGWSSEKRRREWKKESASN